MPCLSTYYQDETGLESMDSFEPNDDYMKRYTYLKGGVRWKKSSAKNRRYLKGGLRWKRRNYLKGGLRF